MQKKIDEIKRLYPDVELKPIDNSVDFTLRQLSEAAIHTLFEGAALAVIVVFLFLRDIRATIIAAVSLPLSIFPAFWAMDVLGFSLNLVSFLAITLSTGILVDDAIVEIENIVRHMRMGKSPYQAAIDAADEIGLAVIAISLTIVAIFTPASFMPGIAGQFFKQFGITVSVQVLFSLLAARLVTPMLAAYFLRHHHIEEKPPGIALRTYTRLVTWSVKHYLVTVLIGLVLFAASVWSITLLSKGFLPAQDSARSRLAIELPPGSQLSDTEKATEEIVRRLRGRPEIASIFVDGGRVPKGAKEIRRASIYINYTPKEERSISQHDLELAIGREIEEIPDLRYWFVDENGLRAITLDVTGSDPDAVANVAEELAAQMRRIPLVADVISETALERPELRIRPHTDMLARLNVTTEGLSETIRVATMGDIGPALARFDTGDRLVPVRVQLDEKARTNLQVIEQLRVPMFGRPGGVPLGAIADISLDQGPTSIDRYDRNRRAAVAADLVGKSSLDDAMKAIYDLPVMKSHPQGIKIGKSGDAENLAELLGRLRQRHAQRPDHGLCRAGAAVRQLPAADHHPVLAAALDRRRHHRAAARRHAAHRAGVDRHLDADGHRHQERDHAGRLRDRIDPWRDGPRQGDHRRRPEAGAAHRDDDHRDDRRHGAERARLRRRRRIPRPDGGIGDRRPVVLDRALARLRSGGVRADGQRVEVHLASRRSPHLHGRAEDQGRLGAPGRSLKPPAVIAGLDPAIPIMWRGRAFLARSSRPAACRDSVAEACGLIAVGTAAHKKIVFRDLCKCKGRGAVVTIDLSCRPKKCIFPQV